jgi:antitoxin component of MazEF toxin-antitoxin module
MKIGKLCTIGDSAGAVIHQQHLEQLGWFRGDQLQQAIEGDTLVLRNLTKRAVRPRYTRKEFGDGVTRTTRRAR